MAQSFGTGLLLIYYLLEYVLDPLRDIPWPFLARFTRLWYCWHIYKGDFEKVNVALHKRYGAIVRIAPHEYSLDDVHAAKTIYGHGTKFIKSSWYWAWMPPDPKLASLFAERDVHRHAAQRRKVVNAYSMSTLVGYEPFVNNCIELLKQRFNEIATSGYTINLGHWLQCYAFDVIGEITFGKRFGFLDFGEDEDGVFRAIDQRGIYSSFVGQYAWPHRYLWHLMPKKSGHGYVGNFARQQIAQRQKELKDANTAKREGPPDFLSRFLEMHEEDPERVTVNDIITTSQSNIGAGSDTTSITLAAVFYHHLRNPETMNRLQDEVDTAAAEGRISSPVSFKEAQELPYLQAVIKEALRLHPATGFPMARVVPSGGAMLAERMFPPNTIVGINSWVAHRNTDVFGTDADRWRPERWFEIESSGRGPDAEKYFLAFGQGSRTCIGKNISLLEMSKLIPELVRYFDFELDPSLKEGELTTLNMWFVKICDFKASVKVRK